MSTSYRFNVDVTNPGQFLACCGLLELANCVDPGSLGHFGKNEFVLNADVDNLVEQFLDASIQPVADSGDASAVNDEAEDDDKSADKSPAVLLGSPFNLRLDWWLDLSAKKAGFKTWAAGQTVIGFLNGMRAHVRSHRLIAENLLTTAVAIETPKPFSFDSQLSALTALTLGFSSEKFTASFSPAAEVLTLVGLQRFRPKTIDLREKYTYDIWTEPLPAPIAAAVAHGLLPALYSHHYQFPLVVRTGGKYKAFGPARKNTAPTPTADRATVPS